MSGLVLLFRIKLYFLVSVSDQTDPFNRSPITLDMLKPHDELRTKIHEWMAEMKAQGKR